VRRLHDEVLRRFPEVARYVRDGDEELPYVVVGYVVDWLSSVAKPTLDPAVVQRVIDFDQWCMRQPPGESAADDTATIETVALRERLFAHDELLPLVPKLMTRDEMLRNGKYLSGWVGADRYQAALRLYDRRSR
jgi:hypothetical protein